MWIDNLAIPNGARNEELAYEFINFILEPRIAQKLTEKLGAIIGKKVVLKPSVDPGVIGGVIARIDGKLLDASTRSQLEALRKEIAGEAIKR